MFFSSQMPYKFVVLGFMAFTLLFFAFPSNAQYVKRSANLEKIAQTEPEIAEYLHSWYDAIDKRVGEIIEARDYWKTQLQDGAINQTDYEMVYRRDVTGAIEDLKSIVPMWIQAAKQTLYEIRNDEVILFQSSNGNTLGNSQATTIRRNGEFKNSNGESKILSRSQVAELERLIKLVPEPTEVSPTLGQSWNSITLYKAGVFHIYDQDQPVEPNRDNLVEFVQSL